ncbi:unnamed protein product [Brassica oleracea var. botrytis]|uniref:RING-type E3 ubiquitin transferase n=3 Tax=Brassica TaxID=3705 RepID=A0A816MRC9_BRANA|nr:unnamed protein product [Brassica napus]
MKSFLPLTRKQNALPALVLFLLLSVSELASSQPAQHSHRLALTINLVIFCVIAILLILAFLSDCIRRCNEAVNGSVDPSVGGARGETNATVARGIDASMIDTFPTFVYLEVKTQKIGNGALECAICLNEFGDDETLRLLPKCDHVFHAHCIGAWLQGHVTCPVCRTNLAYSQQQMAEPVEPEVITETDIESQQTVNPEPAVEQGENVARVKFSRSHTTGHSVVLPGECADRFTLRLPDDLRNKLMASGKMTRSKSLLILPRSTGKPVDRSLDRWDQWLFIKTPPFMWRSRDDGSIRRGRGASI